MEAVVLIGCQAAGKSTFYRERFFSTHVRVNLDMLRTRTRERLLIEACVEMKQRFVVDNTNPMIEDRRRYFSMLSGSGFRVIGFYFELPLADLLRRNSKRQGQECIPEIAVRGTFKKLTEPSRAEGFDNLFRVRVGADGRFDVEGWTTDEV